HLEPDPRGPGLADPHGDADRPALGHEAHGRFAHRAGQGEEDLARGGPHAGDGQDEVHPAHDGRRIQEKVRGRAMAQIDRMLHLMKAANASDLPLKSGMRPRYRVLGELRDVEGSPVMTREEVDKYTRELL